MINLDKIKTELSSDIETTQKWADELYEKSFGNYLKGIKELYSQLESNSRPITDAELEEILTTLPLKLITISEILSQFKISKEVVNITLKQKEAEFIQSSTAKTITQKKEDASVAVLEYKLVQTVYATVINRVENEMNFARELIMSAKKIWDARKATEGATPTSPVITGDNSLPEYHHSTQGFTINKGQTYVK